MTTNVLTITEANSLRAILRRELSPAPRASAQASAEADIRPGDVVQIRPFASPTFGGMLAMITKAGAHELRAYLLRPHRGGCSDAWLRLKHCEVERVGRGFWPADATAFAARCEDQGTPRCARLLRQRAALAARLNRDAA
ncbi:MAG: hypothetical protein ABSH44_17135 [Bryobacteraceae bacterium]|jgi:hypothetical protein